MMFSELTPDDFPIVGLDYMGVMQDDLRHEGSLPEMIEYVQSGGFWTPDFLVEYATKHRLRTSPIIQISRFEDGQLFVHDGHHRCVATWLGGRNFIRRDEYHEKEWSYDQYLEINHPNGWYTPFDPRNHVRTADFAAFKRQARDRFLADATEAERWIVENAGIYRRDKTFRLVPELAKAVGNRLALVK